MERCLDCRAQCEHLLLLYPLRIVIVGLKFTAPRFIIYWALCDQLETLGQITVATECFHHLMSELGGDKNLHAEHAEWVDGEQSRVLCTYYLISYQASSSVSPRNWSVLEMPQSMLSNITRPYPSIQQHYPSIWPYHRVSSSNEAKRTKPWVYGRMH